MKNKETKADSNIESNDVNPIEPINNDEQNINNIESEEYKEIESFALNKTSEINGFTEEKPKIKGFNDTNLPVFLTLSREEQQAAVEAIIFSAEEQINTKTLFKILITSDINIDDDNNEQSTQLDLEQELKKKYNINDEFFENFIIEINNTLMETGRPYKIVNYAGGWQFATLPVFGQLVQKLIKSKTKRRLSQASLETLSIIAYRQPVTKQEIEQIRGTNSNEIVNALLDKNLIKIAGRKDVLGKPLLYATTSDFLKMFGLNSLKELPKLREFEDLATSEPESDSSKLFSITISDEDLINKEGLKPGTFVEQIEIPDADEFADQEFNQEEAEIEDIHAVFSNNSNSPVIKLDDGTEIELDSPVITKSDAEKLK